MADDIIAEAIARVEHKVDALMHHFKVKTQPMHFPGQICPACKSIIDYQVDILKGVVVRKCQCKTGKVAPTIPLLPVPQVQAKNGNPANSSSEPTVVFIEGPPSKDNRRR